MVLKRTKSNPIDSQVIINPMRSKLIMRHGMELRFNLFDPYYSI